MEVERTRIHWLDELHPNYKRWASARKISLHRGEFVQCLISSVKICKQLKILDLGSGEGGTSKVFSDDNFVVSFDISKIRLNRQAEYYSIQNRICGDTLSLPFKNNSFDLIIMQDVLEHINYSNDTIKKIRRLLNENGTIYLSTPNRNSIINILADPHWGLPVISLLNRKQIRKYFLKFFRKSEINRCDLAELLSLKKILELFSDKFEIKTFTTYAVRELFKGNPGIVWSRFHLKIILFAKKTGMHKIVLQIANDKPGIVNNYLTPTYYFILEKK